MEAIANGHEIDHNHEHANFIAENNQVPNGELQAGYENGFALVDHNSNNSSKEVDLTLTSLQSVLFPLILKVVHVILRIAITLSLWVKRLQKKTVTNWLYRKVCDEKDKVIAILFNEGKSLKDEVRKISFNTCEQKFFDRLRVISDSTLKKKPSHIAFALSEANNFSIRDIANLIAWSVNLGINNVSLYDIDGMLKKHTDTIDSELLKKLPKNILKSHPILWNTHSHRNLNECRNEIRSDEMILKHQSSEDMIKIDVLDKEDGQGNFTDMTQSIAQKVKSGELSVEAIDDQFIDLALRRNLGFKDPDLLIRFGLTSSNLGFLPWHIRLTEIHDIPTHLDVECWDLFLVLLRYSKCEQRFGR